MSEHTDAGKRRPVAEDLEPLLHMVSEGKSLRAACRELGIDPPSAHRWLEEDAGRRQQYAGAREGRAEHYQEVALEYGHAAATGKPVKIDGEEVNVDPAGYRAFLDGIKWATARMAPKAAPVQRIDLTSRTRQMTDEEIAGEIAAREARAAAED